MSLRFRRHYKLLVLLALVAVVLGMGLGNQRIIAYHVEDPGQGLAQQEGAGSDLAHVAGTVVQGIQTLISNVGGPGTDQAAPTE